MDLQQIIRNTTADSMDESCGGNSSHSSNTAVDRDDQNDSIDGIMLSPNSKINNVK